MMINFFTCNFFSILFFMGFFSLCLNRKSLMMVLMSLEYIILMIYFSMIIYLNYLNMEMYFSMFFLVFSVCEGVLGLSILIYMVRVHGNDNFQVLSIL